LIQADEKNSLLDTKFFQRFQLQTKLQEYVRECMREEVGRLHTEIAELRARVATLEAERAQNAAESLESSF